MRRYIRSALLGDLVPPFGVPLPQVIYQSIACASSINEKVSVDNGGSVVDPWLWLRLSLVGVLRPLSRLEIVDLQQGKQLRVSCPLASEDDHLVAHHVGRVAFDCGVAKRCVNVQAYQFSVEQSCHYNVSRLRA